MYFRFSVITLTDVTSYDKKHYLHSQHHIWIIIQNDIRETSDAPLACTNSMRPNENKPVVLKVLGISEGPASAVPWVGLWSVIVAFLLAL